MADALADFLERFIAPGSPAARLTAPPATLAELAAACPPGAVRRSITQLSEDYER